MNGGPSGSRPTKPAIFGKLHTLISLRQTSVPASGGASLCLLRRNARKLRALSERTLGFQIALSPKGSGSQMAQIFVQHTHHNPKSTDLTGLDFLVEYEDATAAVSIQEMRGGSFQARQDAYRVAIRRLARAMLAAAQSPQGVVEALRP
jgi:hypothetical protein